MLVVPGQMLLAAYAAFTLLLLLRCGLGRRTQHDKVSHGDDVEAVRA
ncbi:MAG TPA: hypothetical protein VHF92_04065 [Geodermatophilus sp.]|nr:hypothetical protein [Geodermatophilus sp.]